MSLSSDSFLHGINPAHVDEVLCAFSPHKRHKVSDLPDEDIRNYHRNQDWFGPRLIETRENKKHQSIANRLGQEAYTPFSFASHGEQVVFLVGIDFPTEGDQDDDNSRAMTLNRDRKFNQPSLRDMMDVWIGILQDNDFDHDVARCLIYSSILIVNLIPITEASTWASKDPTGYDSVKNEITASNKAMLKNVIDMCPNVLGLLALGEAAYDGFPHLLQGTRISMINEERVMHPSC